MNNLSIYKRSLKFKFNNRINYKNNLAKRKNNYYKLLNVDINSSYDDIYYAYRKSLKKYNFKNELTKIDIETIKKIKKGFYILSNNQLRLLYNKAFKKEKKLNDKLNINNKNNDLISDRIFSLQEINKLPQKNIDFENQFLKDVRNNSNINI